jgi:MarR family transcriptional regulator, transcriptional regulator for hemolysin
MSRHGARIEAVRDQEPVGVAVARAGRVLNKAFDETLARVGGSLPVWLIVTTLKRGDHTTQREIAASVGIEDATLTHHLHRMEQAGLVSRHRAQENRRVQIVALTPAGEGLFVQMLGEVRDFDKRLRHGLTSGDLTMLRTVLAHIVDNVGTVVDTQLP